MSEEKRIEDSPKDGKTESSEVAYENIRRKIVERSQIKKLRNPKIRNIISITKASRNNYECQLKIQDLQKESCRPPYTHHKTGVAQLQHACLT